MLSTLCANFVTAGKRKWLLHGDLFLQTGYVKLTSYRLTTIKQSSPVHRVISALRRSSRNCAANKRTLHVDARVAEHKQQLSVIPYEAICYKSEPYGVGVSGGWLVDSVSRSAPVRSASHGRDWTHTKVFGKCERQSRVHRGMLTTLCS